ncbi:uncharacterized protein LOC110031538 [Phalaenopsis equestris]|uniref:uncharacterized protein LOC110031538 n=1 Tax=Phalaenopsis equestris TaxID=78828 RepID=UPI0009E229A2|nr:uncharacterized protein LOC110031538 [Phalaenopsis equestris]
MSLWLGSGRRSASFADSGVGFSMGLEKRRVVAISEDGDGSENNSHEREDVKPYTTIRVSTSNYFTQEGETLLVQLPTSMHLWFGHVRSYQIRPNNLPKQVLSMRRAGDANVVAQFVAHFTRQFIEVWKKKQPNEGTEKKIGKLIEENIGKAMNFLQSSVSSTLKLPEPNAPL